MMMIKSSKLLFLLAFSLVVASGCAQYPGIASGAKPEANDTVSVVDDVVIEPPTVSDPNGSASSGQVRMVGAGG